MNYSCSVFCSDQLKSETASFSLLLILLDATHHINQLGELEFELDCDGVRDIHDWPDQLVVGGEQVIKQPLGIRVTRGQH